MLDEKYLQYRNAVLAIDDVAEMRLLSHLGEHNVKACGAQSVLKFMRNLQRAGELNKHIQRYRQLQAAVRIVDLAPAHTTSIIRSITTQ